MISSVKARYTNGALVPLEPLDLEEGEDVIMSVTETSDAEAALLLERIDETGRLVPQDSGGRGPSGSVQNNERYPNGQIEGPLLRILDKVQERHAHLPPDTWDDLPTDLVKNKKHYLYGHPKEDD